MKGVIHSFETFGTVDGPGIRFVVFFKGCPLRCLYCHNPDTWTTSGGKLLSVDEIVSNINKYRNYYQNGGVTISGGEPLMQLDFLIELAKKIKENKYHLAIDTSGWCFNSKDIDKYLELNKYVDLYLLDIKAISKTKHLELTSKSNESIIDFARFLDKEHKDVWIRHVIVPTINIDEESLKSVRNFIDTLSNVKKIEVLPYHTMGEIKYQKLGIDYPLKGIEAPSKEQIQLAKKILLDKEDSNG